MAVNPRGKGRKPFLLKWRGTERDPATFIAEVMIDNMAPMDMRMDAAKALLPYVHKRLPLEKDDDDDGQDVKEIIIRVGHAGNA